MSQENVQLIQSMYEAFGRGDVAAVLAGMDPNIEWREADNFPYADRNPYQGPQAIVEGIFVRFATEWDGFKVTPQEWFDAGDHVIVTGTYTGTYKGTRKTVQAPFAHFWKMRASKVVKYQQYTDTKQFAATVG